MAEPCAIPEPPSFDQHCDPARLKAVGESVRAKLMATSGVEHVDIPDADVFIVPGFLKWWDCRRIVRMIDKQASPSTLYRGTEREGFRSSSTHHFDRRNKLTLDVERYLSDLVGIDLDHGEPLQGQRYAVGQEFRAHHDFFHVGEHYWQQEARRGGQRTWTAMAFLNEPKEGGETNFPQLDIAMRPQTGGLVIWNNMDREGYPNMKTLHAGIPVRRGVKHVITKWFRLEPWRNDASRD